MSNEQREELLIARVAGGEASPDDWDALFDAGPGEDTLWRRLAESQRDQAQLAALLARADEVAERIVVPADAATGAPAVRARHARSRDIVRGGLRGHWGGWRAWTGWAVAAALVAAWSLSITVGGSRSARPAPTERSARPLVASTGGADGGHKVSGARETGPVKAPVPVTPVSTQQAFRQYLERGQAEGTVLGVMPRRVILETRPNPDGRGYELIYLQQIMERTVVPDLYQLEGLDERGRPGLVRYEQPARREM